MYSQRQRCCHSACHSGRLPNAATGAAHVHGGHTDKPLAALTPARAEGTEHRLTLPPRTDVTM